MLGRVRQYSTGRSKDGKWERQGFPEAKMYEHAKLKKGHDLLDADHTNSTAQARVKPPRAGPSWQLLP